MVDTQSSSINHHHNSSWEWYIYPSTTKYYWKKGKYVVIKSKDANEKCLIGHIIQVTENGLDIQIGEGGHQVFSEPKDMNRVLPCFQFQRTIIFTAETRDFRQLVHQLDHNDHVLEIGCSTGETSRLVIPRVNSWVGFDTSDEMIQECKKHMKGKCHIAKANGLVNPSNAFQEAITFGHPSVVMIDIGGNRELVNVLRIFSWVMESFEPRLIVIKSRNTVKHLESTATIEAETGLIVDGENWFRTNRRVRAIPKHPLRAPLVISPKDKITPICRFRNYHKNGCYNENCPFDHEFCHACLQAGHIALECIHFQA